MAISTRRPSPAGTSAVTQPGSRRVAAAGTMVSTVAAPPLSERRAGTPADDALTGLRFTIVPHTHWDREWYLPFDVFRIRLARAVERICEVLEADPAFRSFTLDGQAVILEDVVDVRPDLEPRIRALLADGRLVTGPSYVLPDEFLAGQEALVRNLLHGRTVCERFGAKPMGVGYMPDTFGHVAQLPQILAGFGLDSFIFWRGLGDDAGRVGLAFAWEAPDGSRVTAIRQLGSYGNANQFGRWGAGGVDLVERPDRYPEGASARLNRFVQVFGAEITRTGSTEVLLCNGSDHEEIHERLPEMVGEVRAAHAGTAMEIGSYEDYWDRLRPTLDLDALPVVRTELVGGRDAPVLRGINSTRMSLKQESERTERALLAAESLAALAQLRFGTRPPLAELRLAWREQLRNMPHDSISGCSIDEVHRDMRQRFATAQRIAGRVSAESLAALAGRRAPWAFAAEPSAAASLVNTLAWRRRVLAELRLPAELEASDVAAVIGDEVLAIQGPVAAEPGSGRTVVVAADVDGYGARDVRVVAAARGTPDGRASSGRTRSSGPAAITNGILTVRAGTDGTLEVTDERNGHIHRGLHRFEDVADRGDEYTFCPVEFDAPIGVERAGRVSVSADGPVVAELTIALELDLPEGLSEDRRRRVGRCVVPAEIRVRLVDGIDRVEIVTTLDNRARDHRLRLRFRAAAANDVSPIRAEGHFAIVDRAARPTWGGGGWTEPPALTAHTSGLVATGELAVIGRGLPEYEAVPTKDGVDLALTLLRCVGWLSRDDLSTRPGGAGPTIATPDAQCLGPATFEYALRFDAASSSNNDLLRQSADYRTRLAVGPPGSEADDHPNLLAVEGDLVATALKPADDGTGAILRVVNANRTGEAVEVAGSWVAQAVRMDETPLPAEPAAVLRPGEIRTLRVTGA